MNSRSIIFEPNSIEFPLVRFKFCDSLKIVLGRDMSIKQILGKVMAIASPIEAKNDLLGKIFLAEEHQSKLEKITSKDRGKGKADLVQMRIKKIVRIDRNPPSPYSIERVSCHFI